MKKSYLLAGLVLFSSIAAAEEISLDTIQVESSTIEDIATDKRTESSTVNIIDEETIEKIDPKNINDLLQTIPGITADVRNDAIEIHMRGIAQQEFMWEDTGVAIVIDGVPVLQNGGKVKFNIDEIESIKVIKGSASYLYGNNALAGAILITTKKPKNKNGGSVKVEAGSYQYRNVKANIFKSTDNFSFNLNANHTHDNSFWDQGANWVDSANSKLLYYLDDTSDLTFGANYTNKYEEGGGSVTGVTNANLYPQGVKGDWSWNKDYYSKLQKYFITYGKEFNNGSNLKINSYYYKDEYDYLNSPQDIDRDGSDDFYKNDNSDDIKQYGIKTEYRGKNSNLAYMIGIDLGKRELEKYVLQLVDIRYRGYAGESTSTNTTENNYAVYSETKYKLSPKLTTILNIRLDYNKYDYESFVHDYNGTTWNNTTADDSKSFKNLTYRIGATYNITSNHTLFSNISTGFRNPTVDQIYRGDFDDDYINNLNLDKETTINYEIGIRGSSNIINNTLYYDASIFVTDTKNIIGKIGGTYYSGDVIYFDNIGDARNKGFELSLKSDNRKTASFSLAYTYLDAYYTTHKDFYVSLGLPTYKGGTLADDAIYDITGNQLPRVPHHKIDLIVNYKLLPKWNLMTELYAQSKYYADETNLVTMPGYGKVNMRVDYDPTKNLEFFVKVDNILDKQYYRTVYLFSDKNADGKLDAEDASITVDPGRVFYAGLKYRF